MQTQVQRNPLGLNPSNRKLNFISVTNKGCYTRMAFSYSKFGLSFIVVHFTRAFLRRGRQPEENISRARKVLSPRFLYYSSLMEKRYLAV